MSDKGLFLIVVIIMATVASTMIMREAVKVDGDLRVLLWCPAFWVGIVVAAEVILT